jgi:hypothetical protein
MEIPVSQSEYAPLNRSPLTRREWQDYARRRGYLQQRARHQEAQRAGEKELMGYWAVQQVYILSSIILLFMINLSSLITYLQSQQWTRMSLSWKIYELICYTMMPLLLSTWDHPQHLFFYSLMNSPLGAQVTQVRCYCSLGLALMSQHLHSQLNGWRQRLPLHLLELLLWWTAILSLYSFQKWSTGLIVHAVMAWTHCISVAVSYS